MSANETGVQMGIRTTMRMTLVMLVVACVTITGCTSTGGDVPDEAPAAEPTLEELWGVEIVALRLTGANYMLDFRYKVLDAELAGELFERANKPVLVHNATGARLEVPRPAKTGPLRPTNPPQAGRTYFMLFANPGVVHVGDEVTIEIGDFEANVIVE